MNQITYKNLNYIFDKKYFLKIKLLKGEFAVVPTDKFVGRGYHQKFPLI